MNSTDKLMKLLTPVPMELIFQIIFEYSSYKNLTNAFKTMYVNDQAKIVEALFLIGYVSNKFLMNIRFTMCHIVARLVTLSRRTAIQCFDVQVSCFRITGTVPKDLSPRITVIKDGNRRNRFREC